MGLETTSFGYPRFANGADFGRRQADNLGTTRPALELHYNFLTHANQTYWKLVTGSSQSSHTIFHKKNKKSPDLRWGFSFVMEELLHPIKSFLLDWRFISRASTFPIL